MKIFCFGIYVFIAVVFEMQNDLIDECGFTGRLIDLMRGNGPFRYNRA